MEIITGSERRRRWRDEDKLRIVAEAEAPGRYSRWLPGGTTFRGGIDVVLNGLHEDTIRFSWPG